ncbi:uncharacterized protein LOC132725173 isoform X2 [Ruditapes philippinarum]|uniref:uncharacterized protein LOC132725173 isoform X2 n=1 Tax=Ruditapes philippinarum TaxID=129788 RepID=UPI00295B296B|nr:uncharacterized protein LOC132725173 isoform X2 [Ruditapes philippinarum]
MDLKNAELTLSNYTFLYQWNRGLTDLDLKRKKADKRERDRMQIRIIDKISNPTLGFEVENFKLFGDLKKTTTQIHNTIPSQDTVSAEKECIHFEDQRRRQPHIAKYNHFYGCIQHEATKPRTPRTASSFAISGIDEDRTSSRIHMRSRNHSRASLFSRNEQNNVLFSNIEPDRRSKMSSRGNKLDFLESRTPVP